MINQIQEPEAREMVIAGGSNTPVGKILVVDDEPELKGVLVESLQRRGYEVTGCGSGREALAELRARDFDLLLTDLMMPEMDGIALLEAALKIDPHVVGVIVTGQGTIQTAVDAMQMGAFDYVLKPFRMQTLMPVLTRAMNVRHLKLENVHLRETVAIHSLCQTIAFTLDPQTVLSKLADAAVQQSDADEVSILLPTSDRTELYVAAVRGEKRERLLGERIPLQQGISSWVARERQPLILNGEVHDARFVALWPRPEIRSAVSVPMQVANKLVGVINLNVTNRLRPFTLGQMKALSILASTAAAALESASLYTQVRTTEEKYRSIFENATEGLFQSTSDGRFLTANPALARILGYDSPEEMVATVTDLAHQLYVNPEDRVEVGRLQEEAGALVGFEMEAYRKDGEKIWLSLNRRSVRNHNGELLYFEGSVENITERKRAEEELKKSEERYRDLVENAHDLIYEHDLEGNYISANRAVEQVTGYSLEESLRLNQAQIVSPHFLEKSKEMFRRKLVGERVTAYEMEIIAKDGHRVAVEVNSSLVLRDGVPVGVRGIARDITERKRVEEIRARRAHHALFRADVSAALALSRAPLRDTLESCVTAIVEHLGAAFARVWTLNPEEEMLELQASAGLYTHIDGPHSRVPVGSFKIGKIAEERAPHITNDVQTDPRVSNKEWAEREGMVAFAGYPLLLENRLLGVMGMFSREELAEDTLDALASVADLISHGIERKRAEEALRDSEARYRLLFESNPQPMWVYDLETLAFLAVNEPALRHYGYSREDFLAMTITDIRPAEDLPAPHDSVTRNVEEDDDTSGLCRHLKKDGTIIEVEITSHLLMFDDRRAELILAHDITERRKAENRLSTQYAVTRALAESNTLNEGASRILQAICESLGWEYGSLWIVDRSSNVLRCAQVWQPPGVEAGEFESISRQSVFPPGVGLPGNIWEHGQPLWIPEVTADLRVVRSALAAKVDFHAAFGFPIQLHSKVVGVMEFFSRTIREPDPDLLAMMVTIGSQIGQFIVRKRVEEALGKSEEQLRQSQKLEAIGQLAGGVAHDFNNLLTAINGYSALALRRLGEDHPISAYLEEIKKAGDRAANLTRQLLAFGRKQLLQPLALNLNDIVGDMIKLLKRLIGEDVQLVTRACVNLKQIKADPGQLEQVLVNLVVNARDAMPRGGTVTIETANTLLDGTYASRHLGVIPGEYVMLAVSDTGVGMDHDTRSHIFEPFFTTKEKGKGTGLGLSTVYGIVRQSGGNIWVYSEPGRGTTFKVYLPQVHDEITKLAAIAEVIIKRGSETVLLVEDEDMVRNLASQILEETGYTVLAANGGEEALHLFKTHKGPIHLMITDVVMPKMSGKDVADKLKETHPETKVLFMSGYTDEAIVHHGIVDSHIAFIQKPFSEVALTQKIRDVLDADKLSEV